MERRARKLEDKVVGLANFMAEFTLQIAALASDKPSLVALAIICIAIVTVHNDEEGPTEQLNELRFRQGVQEIKDVSWLSSFSIAEVLEVGIRVLESMESAYRPDPYLSQVVLKYRRLQIYQIPLCSAERLERLLAATDRSQVERWWLQWRTRLPAAPPGGGWSLGRPDT